MTAVGFVGLGAMGGSIAAAATRLDPPLPSAAIAHQLFTAAHAMGYEDKDIAVVYKVLAELAGQ
jgi:3-hydroxyisobutyrate dehydrogenase-like beta-hydroxyacid dehydrogenase